MRTLTLIAILFFSFAALAERTVTWVPIEDYTELSKEIIEHSELKDPFSAQYRNVYKSVIAGIEPKPDTYIWCGDIAAKNSWGAYGGFAPFVLTKSGMFRMGGDDDEYGFSIIMIRTFCDEAPDWAWGEN